MADHEITRVHAREIIDCRGWPTLEVEVWVAGRLAGSAHVPAGRSTGRHEACELRDGDPARYRGLGVRRAVGHVNDPIARAVVGLDVTDQRALDRVLIELDGTPDKRRLGANALLGVSLAAARAGATTCGVPLYRYLNPTARVIPVPLMNCLNGGRLTANELEIQEFMILPVDAGCYAEALRVTTEVNEALRELVVDKYGLLATNTGDEGGFATPMRGIWEPLETLARAVEKAGFEGQVLYGLDCAANSWYEREADLYTLDGRRYERDALIELYKAVAARFPLASIEDPLHEEDFEGFARLTRELGDTQVVGDDLFVTNVERLRQGVAAGAANAMLFKVNQIGTLSEALDAASFAYRHGYGVQVSERSGETEDAIIADLVVALASGQIKTGMPVRGERTAKHNRLLAIEEALGDGARYAGRDFRRPI